MIWINQGLWQIIQAVILIALAPLLLGWVNQCRAWLQNKRGAGVLQPYRNLRRLFSKEAVVANNASWIFRSAPYMRFACMCLAIAIVPVLTTKLLFTPAADVIALVGIFAFSRMYLALAAMDIGTAFGSMGARREMLVAFLAEPALLMVFFNAALISHSTALTSIVNSLTEQSLIHYHGMLFACVAFFMILLAENARIPIDNPSTHLELTMIHEAMILEYSGRHLALTEWANAIKLLTYFSLAIVLFFPYGIMEQASASSFMFSMFCTMIKLAIIGTCLAYLETVMAKMRIFQIPDFISMAFLLAVLGILTYLLWG